MKCAFSRELEASKFEKPSSFGGNHGAVLGSNYILCLFRYGDLTKLLGKFRYYQIKMKAVNYI